MEEELDEEKDLDEEDLDAEDLDAVDEDDLQVQLLNIYSAMKQIYAEKAPRSDNKNYV